MSALFVHTVFVLAVFGTKVIIALWAIYYLFPSGRSCPECDAETFPVQTSRSRRVWGVLLFLGRVRLRWCPECSWEGWTRYAPHPVPLVQATPVEGPAGRPRSLLLRLTRSRPGASGTNHE
jgi:hypothetical protein